MILQFTTKLQEEQKGCEGECVCVCPSVDAQQVSWRHVDICASNQKLAPSNGFI